jgi:imidazolonepropionase-like amidohydrolase
MRPIFGMGKENGVDRRRKFADIFAISASPIEDVSVLENLKFFMKGGVVQKNIL